jgi:biopolymer transport protein ExbD
MGFEKYRRRRSELPEINLVPMMDVLMTVLTFFIIVAMTLTGEQIANITLPGAKGAQAADDSPRLVIGLNDRGQMNIDRQWLEPVKATTPIQTFLRQNPQGQIVLKADRRIDYRYVEDALRRVQSVGGDRIFLAIEPSS